jgi:uncharacterized protein (DUF1499 family)
MSLGALLLGYPAYLGFLSCTLPMINDITTDPANPPQYKSLAHLRPRGAIDYPGGKVAALQRSAYPDIAPLQLDVRPPLAYSIALKIINGRKWQVVNSEPPQSHRDGTIEAVARTPLMGLRHDVIVRVSASGNGSRIDARSASRFGVSDLGANAKRVRELLDDIDDAAGAAPASGAAPEKKARH